MLWIKKEEEKTDQSVLVKTIEELTEEKKHLKEEVENLKLKAKIADEDIKHMIKMKEEKNGIEFQKKVAKVEQEKDQAIAAVKDEYRNKMEKNLTDQKNDILGMYKEILQRLPDVSARLKIS